MSRRSGGTATLNTETIEALRGRLRGTLCLPGEPAYDTARTIWNAMIDPRPAVIVRAAGAADVILRCEFGPALNGKTNPFRI